MMTQTHPDFQLSSYDFELDPILIAQRPTENRDECRLLIYNARLNEIIHTTFNELPKYLDASHTLVLNNSKVFPARLLGKKESGGAAEVLVLSLTAEDGLYPCMVKCSGSKEGKSLEFGKLKAKVIKAKGDGTFLLNFQTNDLEKELIDHALIPIPPYIRDGVSDEKDRSDYQTTFAKHSGSVAAPTAGLHFTPELLEKFDTAEVTLHVGPGTFAPVKSENILEHKMHSEPFMIEESNFEKIYNSRNLVAVGTTALRVLESINFKTQAGVFESTDIFLHPGKEVKSVKGLITNFHLPKSSLLMLVSALIGREKTLELYQEAIKEKYRFYSYGDAMLVLR